MTEKRRLTSEEMIEAGKKHGVEVTISKAPAGVTGHATFFPGIRAAADDRRADLLQDDDGTGVVE